ncbi:hypothetical protein LWI28_000612 [Acer negundo]|uniref:Uncharacterized protein n=1 Tax=Acer negundo TaxID=4023 RepID=A0AAD5ICA0_ACENE|nr:hypothetical protein LWI28_000612 [Acer negundo]
MLVDMSRIKGNISNTCTIYKETKKQYSHRQQKERRSFGVLVVKEEEEEVRDLDMKNLGVFSAFAPTIPQAQPLFASFPSMLLLRELNTLVPIHFSFLFCL